MYIFIYIYSFDRLIEIGLIYFSLFTIQYMEYVHYYPVCLTNRCYGPRVYVWTSVSLDSREESPVTHIMLFS